MFSFLSNYMLLSLSQLYSVWEAKPNCIGEPLKPEQFSCEGDVGFIRDICVDIVARNIYTRLGFPVSRSCEELAKMKTSTASLKFLKWKRSSKRNEKATNEIMAKANELMEDLLMLVARNRPVNTDVDVKEFVYDRISDAIRRLIDSGVVALDSEIVDSMEDIKVFVCKPCAMSDNEDLRNAFIQFIRNFETSTGKDLLNPRIEDDVARATVTTLYRLHFYYKEGEEIWTSSVIMKIPSLAPFYNTRWKRSDMYRREAEFYETILPALYEMGKCEPFAPRHYTLTERYALVMEDLSFAGYSSPPIIESLDLDHSRIFLNVLAQYHAFGYVYFQNLDEDNPVKQVIGPHLTTIRRAISKDEFDHLCKMVKPILSETLYQKILVAEDKILAELPIQNKNDPNSINVIMHGDLHRKNFLFQYDSDKKVIGVKLIDWQICTVGNLALDLIEFFVHNLHEEIFEANEDNLLEFYIGKLNRNLSSVQSYRRYNRLELNRDLEFFKYYYFRVLSDIVIYWGAKDSSEQYELVATNMAKWIMYFEKKGYI